jgi:hypothetical protein
MLSPLFHETARQTGSILAADCLRRGAGRQSEKSDRHDSAFPKRLHSISPLYDGVATADEAIFACNREQI